MATVTTRINGRRPYSWLSFIETGAQYHALALLILVLSGGHLLFLFTKGQIGGHFEGI